VHLLFFCRSNDDGGDDVISMYDDWTTKQSVGLQVEIGQCAQSPLLSHCLRRQVSLENKLISTSRAPFFLPHVVSWHLINRVLSTYNKMCTYSTRMLLFRRLQSPCTRDLPSIQVTNGRTVHEMMKISAQDVFSLFF